MSLLTQFEDAESYRPEQKVRHLNLLRSYNNAATHAYFSIYLIYALIYR